jgi:hypothetical protein
MAFNVFRHTRTELVRVHDLKAGWATSCSEGCLLDVS